VAEVREREARLDQELRQEEAEKQRQDERRHLRARGRRETVEPGATPASSTAGALALAGL
jgi:hypothetical protein